MAKIRDFIERAEKLFDSGVNKPEFKAWRSDVVRYLNRVYGDVSHEAVSFENIEFYNFYFTFDFFNGFLRKHILKEKEIFQKGLKTAIFYLKNYESDSIINNNIINIEDKDQKNTKETVNKNSLFVVHWRDDDVKKKVVNFLLKLGIEPIILNDQINKGQSIIEKYKRYSDVKAAVIIYSSDDVGNFNDDSELEKRTRQNMIFEAGFFLGKLGKKYTIILLKQGLEIPPVLDGYAYFEVDQEEKWQLDVLKKLKSMKKFDIDMDTPD